jgi:hypothetical protein
MTWYCYVNNDLYTDFPEYPGGGFLSMVGSFTSRGSFTLKEKETGTYTVYCTAGGEVTDNGSTVPVGPAASAPVSFTVSDCTGSVDYDDDEQTNKLAQPLILRWTSTLLRP